MDSKNGGSAFPWSRVREYNEALNSPVSGPGMSLRDYFATAELSKVNAVSVCDVPEAYERLAVHCYRMADAMLKERAK